MLPVVLMEPVSQGKRRRYSETLMGPKGRPQPILEDVKQRLREIRDYSLSHLDTLAAELAVSISAYPEVEITFANDAGQAVETIGGIAGGTKIAVNKSSVIANELMPILVASGYNVVESYYDEFEPFDNRSSEYWQLPVMTLESRLQSFEKLADLAALRSNSVQENGTKDFIGLLGVNAISAQGTVLMLQHMHNISEVFEQARELILVAGLDKIVKSLDDAIFQTKCMAIFGSEALPLTLGGRAKQESSLDELPFDMPLEQNPSKIHLILLDNGRSQVLESPYKELLSCIDCRACTKGCPASPFFVDGTRWSPREYIYFFITGKSPSLERCLQCKTCEANCPLDIGLPGMILKAKTEFRPMKRPSLTNTLLSNGGTLEKWGSSVVWLANALSNNRPLRWLGEEVLGISRERQLPRMNRRTFARWFIPREVKG